MLAAEISFLLLPVDLQSLPDRPSCDEQRSSSWSQLLPSPDWVLLVDSLLPGFESCPWRALLLLVNLEGLTSTAACQTVGAMLLVQKGRATNSPGLCLCRWDNVGGQYLSPGNTSSKSPLSLSFCAGLLIISNILLSQPS